MTTGRRALVTGASGFIAGHVVPQLLADGWHVQGISRHGDCGVPVFPDVTIDACDLTGDPERIHDAVARARPDVVIHLAAMIPEDRQSTAWSWLDLNGRATDALLTACRDVRPLPRVVVMSSGAVYGGGSADASAFRESAPLAPATSYGVSKVLIEALATRAAAAWGVDIVRLRLFNVTGPGEPAHLAMGGFVRQLAEIHAGRRTGLSASGDLSTARDFLDVRDAARAIALAAGGEVPPGAYNVCSGRATPMADMVKVLLQHARLPGTVSVESRSTTPDPIRTQRGDASRLAAVTGWEPARTIEESLRDLLAEHGIGAAAARAEERT